MTAVAVNLQNDEKHHKSCPYVSILM